MVDTEGSSGGAGDGGLCCCEVTQSGDVDASGRAPPRLQRKTLTTAAEKYFFKEYNIYETELLWDTSMDGIAERRPATLGDELISEGQGIMSAVRFFYHGHQLLTENDIREGLERTAGICKSADNVDVGTFERDAANFLRVDSQLEVNDRVHAIAERAYIYLLKSNLS